MNKFIVLVCCLASLVSARPDVSLGYHYHPGYNSGANLLTAPAAVSSYSPAASGNFGGGVGGFDGGVAAGSSGSLSGLSPGYISGGGQGFSGVIGVGGGDSGLNVIGQGSGFSGAVNQGFIGGGGGGLGGSLGGGFGGGQGFIGGASSLGFSGQGQFQAPIITKNFYVHSAPEDHDDQQIVRYITIGRPQKNYRVLFINAPSSTSTRAKIIANVAPVEDRTAIYVLSKKTNDLDIAAEVVTPAPTGPIKPDVFFIKYKTPEEAVHAQHVIQAQYDQLGGSTNFSNEGFVPVQSVIGSLGDAAANSNNQGSAQFISTHGAGPVGNVQLLTDQSQFDQISAGKLQPKPNYLPPSKRY